MDDVSIIIVCVNISGLNPTDYILVSRKLTTSIHCTVHFYVVVYFFW